MWNGSTDYCTLQAWPAHKASCKQDRTLIESGVQKILQQPSFPDCSLFVGRAFGTYSTDVTTEDRERIAKMPEDEQDEATWTAASGLPHPRVVTVDFALKNMLPGTFIDGLTLAEASVVLRGNSVARHLLRVGNRAAELCLERPAESA